MELRKRTFCGKLLQEATVQKYLSVVSAVLSDAKRNEIIQKNPARMIDLPDIVSKPQAIPTNEEAEEILNIIADIDDPYKTFYALAIYTGCRRGELCALKWSDFIVDGYEGTLMISRSRSMVLGKGIVEGTTKNGRSRTIYMRPANGVNLTDINNIVVSDMSKVKCLQMIGRARVSGKDDRKALYVKRFGGGEVGERLRHLKRQKEAYRLYNLAYSCCMMALKFWFCCWTASFVPFFCNDRINARYNLP